MKKQVSITVKGEFNSIEFKNFVAFRVNTFNMQNKEPMNPEVTGYVDAPKDNIIYVVFEGDEFDLNKLVDDTVRGPVISHIKGSDVRWNQYSGKFRGFHAKKNLEEPHSGRREEKRRRR